MTDVVVIGASGFGRECLDVILAMKESGTRLNLVGVLDDRPSEANLQRLEQRDVSYLGGVERWLANAHAECRAVVGVGSPPIRESLTRALVHAGIQPQTLVHPDARIGSIVSIGAGAVICSGATVSTNVTIGGFVHLNPNVTIGHDAVLHDFVSINPGAIVSGEVRVGGRTLVGAGAVILQGLEIGADSTIGAGAVVTRDVPDSVVVKGVPGRWNE